MFLTTVINLAASTQYYNKGDYGLYYWQRKIVMWLSKKMTFCACFWPWNVCLVGSDFWMWAAYTTARGSSSLSVEVTKHPVLWSRTMLHSKFRVKQGIKYFFGSFIRTFLWYLCIHRSESQNQNENFKYHIYCIHVLNGFGKMNFMLTLKTVNHILLVSNKIRVNGKKLS